VPEHSSLNNVSKAVLNFPADFLAVAQSYGQAETTVNGISSQLIPLVPKNESSRGDSPVTGWGLSSGLSTFITDKRASQLGFWSGRGLARCSEGLA
jgi:hypothetical protein